jgi:hypothetical protein
MININSIKELKIEENIKKFISGYYVVKHWLYLDIDKDEMEKGQVAITYANDNDEKEYKDKNLKDDETKEIKLIGLPIIKGNATALGIKIYEEVLKPLILKQIQGKFSKEFIVATINNLAPSWAKRYKFVVKPSKSKYETIYSSLFFPDTTGFTWFKLKFPAGVRLEDNRRPAAEYGAEARALPGPIPLPPPPPPPLPIKVTDCGICFEEKNYNIEGDDPLRIVVLPCGHTFHKSCVNPWIATRPECPTCRAPARMASNLMLGGNYL